ncbi:MAG: hypothetical protein QHJ34_15155 [bacterium]|nr:hypothetical protein [candidate division KSB1 bacterium]MDH7561540.1 hypothetical protein [bacterium]
MAHRLALLTRKVALSMTFLVCFLCAGTLHAQDSLRLSMQGEDQATAQTLYELALLRVQRIVPDFWTRGDTNAVAPEVRPLLQEALRLAGQREWAAAEALLSVVADYVSAAQSRPTTLSPTEDQGDDQAARRARWYPELFMGMEGWRQRFSLPGELQDTTLAESSGNPLLGVRLAMERGTPRDRLVDGSFELRSSRDYQTGRLSLGYRARFKKGHYLALQNDLEGTAFRDPGTPDYARGNLRAELTYALAPELTTALTYTGSLQRYANPGPFYASFVAHRLGGGVTAIAGPATRLSVGYGFEHWRYPSAQTRDLEDHRLSSRFFHRGLFVEGSARYRLFVAPFADSLYNNDYLEAQVRAEWRRDLLPGLGLVLRAELWVRDYAYPSSATPDYRVVDVAPALRFAVTRVGALEVGYQLQKRTPAHTASLTDDPFARIDEYVSQGPTLSVEVSGPGGLLVSANASVGKVAYTASPAREASGLSFFSDRRASAVMCFVTWPLSLHWELELMANHDADLDTGEQDYDSRASFLTLELRYRF